VEDRDARSVFVSHVNEDRAVAGWLQDQLRADFLNEIDVFVSSEREGHAGDHWLETIDDALHKCSVLLALCSPISIHRPWVNFELGAAWILKKRIVPVCHAGLTPEDLKIPLSLLQGITLTEPEDIERLYDTLARQLGFQRTPRSNFAQLAAEVPTVAAPEDPGGGDGSMELQIVARDRDIRQRLRQALEKGQKWRTVGRIAVEAAVTEDVALDVLRADEQVRFSRGRHGDVIVGLIDRVGVARARVAP
jgi:hypothetical protein